MPTMTVTDYSDRHYGMGSDEIQEVENILYNPRIRHGMLKREIASHSLATANAECNLPDNDL